MRRASMYLAAAAIILFVVVAGRTFSGAGSIETPAALDERFCADVNGDGAIDIADAVSILNYSFLGTSTPYCIAQSVTLDDLFARRVELEQVQTDVEALSSQVAGLALVNVVEVEPVGAPNDNGAALLQALAAITDASETNPYKIKIGPGVYDLGGESLVMKAHVDIEGCGEQVTRIVSCGFPDDDRGTVVGTSNAALRFLAIENYGFGTEATGKICEDGTYAIGLYNESASPELIHVTVHALQDLASGVAFAYAIFNTGAISGPRMNSVRVVARGKPNSSNCGVFNRDVAVVGFAENSFISATGGVRAVGVCNDYLASFPQSSLSRMVNVEIWGDSYALRNTAVDGHLHRLELTHSQIGAPGTSVGIQNDGDFQVRLVESEIDADVESQGDGTLIRNGTLYSGDDDSMRYQMRAGKGCLFEVGEDASSWVEIAPKTVRVLPLGFRSSLIDTSTGAYLSLSGTWTNSSDVRRKRNLEPVDGRTVLERLAGVAIQTWNSQADDPAIRHIGPTAQDFHAAFGFGEDDLHISTIDADGVALAAIQGLYELLRETDTRVRELESALAADRCRMESLEERLEALEARVESAD